jgi:hypothetical protein
MVASTSSGGSTAPPLSIDPDLLPRDEDLLYEEELLRNPYSLKMWWRYLEARKGVEAKRRYIMYERAIAALPGSYKVGIAPAFSQKGKLVNMNVVPRACLSG